MSRSQRLLALIQLLRSHRYPVAGEQLASVLGISLRTLYRDIATLKEQGAHIEGEPGLGYVLHPGFMLPPLMFTEEEIEALVLGSRWIANHSDLRMRDSALNALNKIASVLPPDLRNSLDANSLYVPPTSHHELQTLDLSQIRKAIRSEHVLSIRYLDLKGVESERKIWPIALGYFDHVRLLAGWCELRQAFRHFRTDRIVSFNIEQRYLRRRQILLKEWREANGFESQCHY